MIKSCSRVIDPSRDKTIMTASPASFSCSELLRSQMIWVKVWGRAGHRLLYVIWNANPEAKESNPGDQVWIFGENIRYLKISHPSEEVGQKENSEMIWHLKTQELKTRERLTNSMRRWTLLYVHGVWSGRQEQGCPLLLKALVTPMERVLYSLN